MTWRLCHAVIMQEQRYTIVCDFRGGTYVAQVTAVDPTDAVRRWGMKLLADKPIPRVSAYIARRVLKTLDSNPPVALDELTGVWCVSAVVGDSLVLVNIVLSA